MDALSRATDEQVRAVCAAFDAVEWPLGRDGYAALAEELGWQPKLETSSGVQHRSSYPVSLPTVRSLVADEAISQVTIAVSDKSDDSAALSQAAISLRDAVQSQLGAPSGQQQGDPYWELGNGGRVWLKSVPKKVLLVVEEQRFADVERAEERLGIDPSRNPGTADDNR